MEEELFDVYIVMVPATSKAFDLLADAVVEWTAPPLAQGSAVTYEEALTLMEELAG